MCGFCLFGIEAHLGLCQAAATAKTLAEREMLEPLPNTTIRNLKARAQRLKAALKVGKDGLSACFITELDRTLNSHELVKVKFDSFKEDKKELAPLLAEKTQSHFVTRVGNVVVLYRPKPTPADTL